MPAIQKAARDDAIFERDDEEQPRTLNTTPHIFFAAIPVLMYAAY